MSDARREDALEFRNAEHVLRVEPWGRDSVRVRAARRAIIGDAPGALGDSPPPGISVSVTHDADGSRLTVGNLRAELSPTGTLRFVRKRDGAELLAEMQGHFAWPGPRLFAHVSDGHYRLEQRFLAYPDEKLFGLGQHQHARLDQKGLVIDLVQRNAEVTIPFALSSRGYGLLWNSPAIGRVELAENGTRWVAEAARQIDYWITAADTPAQILHNYADATGHAPAFPAWAAGLWQSRLRYTTQDELLEVARSYRHRGLPLSVIVADYFHWPHLGDWRFDTESWPDPKAMIKELEALGVRLMVSVWPSVSPLSDSFDEMNRQGMLIATEQGVPYHHVFPDRGFHDHAMGVSFYDATDPGARDYLWKKIKQNYYDLGVRVWWLDACEPEIFPEHFSNLRFSAGPGREVANLYPREHARGFYENMAGNGESDIISLVRSAWAGSQRYGTVLWSGDIPATFDSLAAQVRAGLNVALSGLPWWTTDIGGFHGGDADSAEYRELVIRWFQYAVFCPLLRMHGHREPRGAFASGHTGGPNELWSFGEQAYQILTAQLYLRERLRDYVLAQMDIASRTGLPPMRPLFVDFHDDPRCWDIHDQYLFGPDLLVAPILTLGARTREVYLPAGPTWTDPGTGQTYLGGQTVQVPAPLERIPVLVRTGASVAAELYLPRLGSRS